MKHRPALGSFLGLGVLVLGFAMVARFLTRDQLDAWVETAGVWAPVALVLAKALTIVIVPLPGLQLYPMGGALFGTGAGTCYLVLGDALGGTLAFAIARRFGRPIVERLLASTHADILDAALARIGTAKGLCVACVCLNVVPEAIAYGAGLTNVRFASFVVIYTATGIVTTTALAWLGAAAVA